MTTCTRCQSHLTYRDADGDVCCVYCGHVAATVPEWIRAEIRRSGGPGRQPDLTMRVLHQAVA